jgi:cytochrome c oxidase subunit 3
MSEAARSLHEPFPVLARQRDAVSFGIWVFIASEVLFFGGMFLCYTVYRGLYPQAFTTAARHTDVFYGTLNTAILLTSSLTMAIGERGARDDERRLALVCLTLTAILGLAFLAVKGFEYRDDLAKGLFPGPHFPLHPASTQIFWALYWVMTGVHAIHLFIGISVTVAMTLGLYWRKLPPISPAFEGLALYWHFVDIVWVMLLPLLYLVGRTP